VEVVTTVNFGAPPQNPTFNNPEPRLPMSSAKYQKLSTSDRSIVEEKNPRRSSFDVYTPPYENDLRFHQPTPSPFARAGVLIFIVFMFWLAFSMRKIVWLGGSVPPPDVHVVF
jgi:hypothetical protein